MLLRKEFVSVVFQCADQGPREGKVFHIKETQVLFLTWLHGCFLHDPYGIPSRSAS